MNALALAAALALAQAPAAQEAAPERAPAPAATPAAAPAPVAAPSPPTPPAPPVSPAPAPAVQAAPGAGTEPSAVTTTVRRRRQPAAAIDPRGIATSTRTAPPTSTDRDLAEQAARAFLDALARGDAPALAQAAADRFSFDGEVVAGREPIRRTWRDLLVARPPAAPPAVGTLEILPAPEAAARFGKAPARLAPLVRQGVLVAVGDVGGRTVVLFLAREGGRMAVLGFHD